jgi:hypothetical protein
MNTDKLMPRTAMPRASSDGQSAQARIADLERQLAEARADTARLDWLEQDNNESIRSYRNGSDSTDETRYWLFKRADGIMSRAKPAFKDGHDNSIRGAIDVARGKGSAK